MKEAHPITANVNDRCYLVEGRPSERWFYQAKEDYKAQEGQRLSVFATCFANLLAQKHDTYVLVERMNRFSPFVVPCFDSRQSMLVTLPFACFIPRTTKCQKKTHHALPQPTVKSEEQIFPIRLSSIIYLAEPSITHIAAVPHRPCMGATAEWRKQSVRWIRPNQRD